MKSPRILGPDTKQAAHRGPLLNFTLRSQWITYASLVLCALLVACGADSSDPNGADNGGKTNWLRACEEDSECGSFRCVAELCTTSCGTAGDCAQIDEDAVCGAPGGGDQRVCLASCDVDDGCEQNAPEPNDDEPCAAKLCGDSCQQCSSEGLCPEEPQYCDAEGACSGSLRECPSDACQQRPADACYDFGCWPYAGSRVSDGLTQPIGCMGLDGGCDDVRTCSIDPDGECWSSSSCVPPTFERVDCADVRCVAPGEGSRPEPGDPEPPPGPDANPGGPEPDPSSPEPDPSNPDPDLDGGVDPGPDPDSGTDPDPDGDGGGASSTGCSSNDDCADTEACFIDACGDEGECGDQTGCIAEFDPVCGCDGETYGNQCTAMNAGAGVAYAGECLGSGCSTQGDCEVGAYCQKATCDAPGECIPGEPPVCPPELEPTCACDGSTVNNSCTAITTGLGVDYQGECADDLARGAMWRSARVSFGFCAGECSFEITRNSADPTQVLYEACDNLGQNCTRSNLVSFNEAGLNQLALAQESFRSTTLEAIYGCPDCADGGATLVRIESTTGLTEHSYEYSDPPTPLTALDTLLLDVHLAMADCSGATYFTIGDDCTSP